MREKRVNYFLDPFQSLKFFFFNFQLLYFVELTSIAQEQLKNTFEKFKRAVCVKTCWILLNFLPNILILPFRPLLIRTNHLNLVNLKLFYVIFLALLDEAYEIGGNSLVFLAKWIIGTGEEDNSFLNILQIN